jgi:cadherin EGF LAG seven-pass G-type receptor 1
MFQSFLCFDLSFYQLGQLETGDLHVTTFVAVKVASDLRRATNLTAVLHGADLLISQELLRELMRYEHGERGLNLTHSQDKDYIQVGRSLLKFCSLY